MTDTINKNQNYEENKEQKITSLQLVGIPPIDLDLYNKLSKSEQVFYHTIPTPHQKTCFVHMGIEDREALMDENTPADEKAQRWATASTRALKVINGGLVRNERSKFLTKIGKCLFGAGIVSMVGDIFLNTVVKNERIAHVTHAPETFDSPLSQLWHVAHGLVAQNAVVAASLLLSAAYFAGMAIEKKRKKDEQSTTFNNIQKPNFLTWYFNAVNTGLDWASNVALKFHQPIYKVLSDFIPDKALRKLDKTVFSGMKGLISGKYSERVNLAKDRFLAVDDGFMWQKARSKDNRTQSTVLAGRMFNGDSLEQYLPMFISEKTYFGSIKSGLIVFLISFGLMTAAYRPDASKWIGYGYTSDRVYQEQIDAAAQALKADNPKLTDTDSEAQAQSLVDETNPNILGGGLLTSFFLSLGIGLMFSRRVLVKAQESIGIPFVKNMPDEYNRSETKIKSHKETLRGSNQRATSYDVSSPLMAIGISTGSMELKGVFGAPRQGEMVVYSMGDQSQNTIVLGGIGSGKTLYVIQPQVVQICNIASDNVNAQQEYEKSYDLRNDKVKDTVDLNTYTPLPIPKMSIAMSIMDIKAQLWKDMLTVIEQLRLEDRFLVIGADQRYEFSIDLLDGLEPSKVISILKSIASQMGGSSEDENNFWNGSGVDYTKHFVDIAFLFARTPEGDLFMETFEMKPVSMGFIFSLAVRDGNRGNQLLAHCITAIYKCIKHTPERIADLINQERLDSITTMITTWQNDLTAEMKGSFQQVIKRFLAGMNNEKLRPFLTGIGENAISVKNLWQYLTAFNLDTDKYDVAGKFVLLFIKTLINEEAVKRQQRYSRRVIELSEHFFEQVSTHFPEHASKLKSKPVSIEMVGIAGVAEQNLELVDKYLDLCQLVQTYQNETWDGGDYLENISKIARAIPAEPFEPGGPYSAEAIAASVKALEIDKQFRLAEARLTKDIRMIDGLDPHWFDVKEGDSDEMRTIKNRNMALYHEYRDAKTRVRREAFYMIGDEYQELITIDKSSGAYTDMNFLNISRSANVKHILATQTLKALIQKVGKETTENFINQFRTMIMLTSEDPDTFDFVEKVAGKADIIQLPQDNRPIYQAGVATTYQKYSNFNAHMSGLAERNRQLLANGRPPKEGYRFTHDIFAEPDVIDVDVSDLKLSNPFSTSLKDEHSEIYVPDFKLNFLDYKAVEQYTTQGSNSQGITDNQSQIQSQWAQAQNKMVEDYSKYATEHIRKDASVFTSQEFRDLGPTKAFVYVTRAGRSFVDEVRVLDWKELIGKTQ